MAKLTPDGRRLIEGSFPKHAVFLRGLMDELTPNEQQHLKRLLKKLGKSVGDPDE